MSTLTSSCSWKAGDVVSDQFPAGLRVLVVDDDPTCLRILEKMLKTCQYQVTTCSRSDVALSTLRDNKNGFDIVLSDVHMPDMDGFKLLEHIGLEMDLPVIMMSADDGKQVVMKGVTHGACDYLIKPIRIEALKNIWQHVVRKRKNEWKELEQCGSVEDGERPQKQLEDVDYSSTANEGSWKSGKKRKEEEDDIEERDDTSTLKKPRVVWSVELHQQFVSAVNQLGIDKAVPKKILELMNVPGLTRENVASHLQKYRLYLRRLSGVPQHQAGVNSSFIGTQDAAFGTISSLNGYELQTLAATGQLPPQSLATLQAAGLGRSAGKSGISIPVLDQRNLFSFDNPKLRFGEGQSQQNLGTNSKQVNLLHGIPTTMEPKQLVNLQQSAQPFGSMSMPVHTHGAQSSSLLMPMGQPQTRRHIISESGSSRPPVLQANMGQSILSTGLVGGALGRSSTAENGRGPGHNTILQTSSALNFPMNQVSEAPACSFPIQSSFSASKGGYPEDVNSSIIKGPGGCMPSYDILHDLQQIRSHDWEFQNVGVTYDTSQPGNTIQGNIDTSGLLLAHQGLSSGQSSSGHNRNISAACKSLLSADRNRQVTAQNVGQPPNSLVDNPVQVKTEGMPEMSYQAVLYPEHYSQEDIMNALLKQQQGIGPSDSEFEFDGFSVNNIPV
ncbi:hypothetical protein BT93_A0301 [Corymbia citriodora subsp. variegata]|nr:hypothetical protein BT93_A0301 [Corymbia citriodora subsp. variegata]